MYFSSAGRQANVTTLVFACAAQTEITKKSSLCHTFDMAQISHHIKRNPY
jgi:hypothetical protein